LPVEVEEEVSGSLLEEEAFSDEEALSEVEALGTEEEVTEVLAQEPSIIILSAARTIRFFFMFYVFL
jgi:hypothetical protein